MRKSSIAILSLFMIIAYPIISIADTTKECTRIASACKKAGYARKDNSSKAFWMGCMKPVLLGKKVAGVHVKSEDIKACKEFKINDMKTELQEFQDSL